ncbi:trigger factor [Candidatus Saccharibacteria bacterium]|nr:MAG: trigger factor [Candidatus Saccharibacteria bacterium]
MKYTAKKLSDTRTKITVTLEEGELKQARALALKHLAPQVKVPGFRKGKVPAGVVEKNIDPTTLANEVVEHAINTAINDIAASEDYRILDRPNVDLKDFKPYESLEFEAEMELLPEVTLGDYKKLKVKREAVTIDAKEIDEVMQRVRQQFAEKKQVKRAAKEGDEVVIDFVGKKDGEAFDGGTSSDYALTLGSGTFIPGFEEAIVDHETGEKFDVPLTFPKDYHAEHLKGAEVVFEVTLTKINEVVLPEVNDELAQKAGGFKTAQELTDDIKREVTAQKEKTADDNYKDALVEALVSVSKVPVPQLLVDDQVRSIERDALQNLMYRGMTAEQYIASQGYKDHDEWREKEFTVAAKRRVQAGLALAELSKVEDILVGQDELSARHAAMLEQYKNNPDVVKQLDTPESRRDLANRLLTEKTVDRLMELNEKK